MYECRTGLSMKERHQHQVEFQIMDDRPKIFGIYTSTSLPILCTTTGTHSQPLTIYELMYLLPMSILVSSVTQGNMGINIQSATRIYLLEPSIDPATEIQVAGRIHRLGQLNDVLVRRFCFRDSIEEKIGKHDC